MHLFFSTLESGTKICTACMWTEAVSGRKNLRIKKYLCTYRRGLHEVLTFVVYIKVIPQKFNLPMNFFEIFPQSSLLSTLSKETIKMIGHHFRLRDRWANLTPFMSVLVPITRIIYRFTLHFAVARNILY